MGELLHRAGDVISGGLTRSIRQWGGFDDVMDYSSDAYRYGSNVGQGINLALMVVQPVGWARAAVVGINAVATAGGVVNAARAALNGDFGAAAMMMGGVALSAIRGGAPGLSCWGTRGLAAVVSRGIGAIQGCFPSNPE